MSMEDTSTITTSGGHDFKPGDYITLTVRDTRWWRRLWFRLLRRGEPQRTVKRRVSQVNESTLQF